jgi:BRCT domain type II-containing protein
MSDGEGWKWHYANKPPAQRKLPEVCFTGFSDSEKDSLHQLATQHGYKVVTTVTRHLEVLCTGENPGPMKLQKAGQQKQVIVMNLEEFKHYLATDEIPITEREAMVQ